jgi:hypothetical protein
MVVTPPVRPVTRPVTGFIDAIAGKLLLQVPPAGVSVRVVVPP